MSDDAIRLTTLDAGHEDVVGPLVRATGAELFDFMYGHDGRGGQVLTQLCAHDDGLWGRSLTTAARDGDRVVGIEMGYDAAGEVRHGKETARHVNALLDPAALAHLRWAYPIAAHFLRPVPADAYYVQTLSVLPEVHGRGVGARLLTAACDRARDAGYASVTLMVAMTNPAVAFYTRQGWEIAEEVRHPEYEREHGLPGQYRMTKRL